MARYFLGVDAGGTKTQVSLANELGVVIGRGAGLGINPHNVPLGWAVRNLATAIAEAVFAAQRNGPDLIIDEFESVCIGMAGFDVANDSQEVLQLTEKVKTKRLTITNDGLIGLKSGTDEPSGVCLIASTGSNCYGLSSQGVEIKAGGWGYLLGDQGSGFAMGRKILERVMKEFDGRREKTDLGAKVLAFLNLKSESALVRWAYQQPLPIGGIASLSQLAGDSGETLWINETVQELSEAYRAVAKQLKADPDIPLPVVLVGGLFKMPGNFLEMIKHKIVEQTPKAMVILPEMTPADGAVKIALLSTPETQLPKGVIISYA